MEWGCLHMQECITFLCRSLEDVQSLHELDLDQLRFVSDSLGDLRREVDPQVHTVALSAVTLLDHHTGINAQYALMICDILWFRQPHP